ncbi:prepilin-type N-terminal cleavage/methylation domain-containing protein [Chloroflexota bacterium]
MSSNQRGFTLIDLTIALAITGLLSLGVSTSIIQLKKGSTYNINQNTAIEQLQNAGHWISNDARMAQAIEPGINQGFPLTLTWTEYGVDGDRHDIVYAIHESGLERREYIDEASTPSTVTAVAENVDLSETSCELNELNGNVVLVVTITSKVEAGLEPASETRKYEIAPKPFRTTSMSGTKFHDLDADGVGWEDDDEPGLGGWTIFVDYDDDGNLDAGEPSDITDADGKYTLYGIASGTWKVKEVIQAGWTNSYPALGYHEEIFHLADSLTGRNFGNY